MKAKAAKFKPGDVVIAKHPLYTRRLVVVSDEGGGWYMCESDEAGKDLYHEKILSKETQKGNAK